MVPKKINKSAVHVQESYKASKQDIDKMSKKIYL